MDGGDSWMSETVRPFVTATANTEINSGMPANDRPAQNHAGRRSEMIFTNPRIIIDQRLGMSRERNLLSNLASSAKASISANPTSAISGSVKIADAALS